MKWYIPEGAAIIRITAQISTYGYICEDNSASNRSIRTKWGSGRCGASWHTVNKSFVGEYEYCARKCGAITTSHANCHFSVVSVEHVYVSVSTADLSTTPTATKVCPSYSKLQQPVKQSRFWFLSFRIVLTHVWAMRYSQWYRPNWWHRISCRRVIWRVSWMPIIPRLWSSWRTIFAKKLPT